MDDLNNKITELFNQGLTFKQIGEQLNVTRAVASGRISRLRAKNPTAFPERRTKPIKPKAVKSTVSLVKKPIQSKKYTIFTKPYRYESPSKAQMYEDLRQAVKNTK